MFLAVKNSTRVSFTSTILVGKLAQKKFSSLSQQPLDLQYERAKPSESSPGTAGPLVICHGLFGSKQNWRSLSKAFAARLGTNIYSLDLRNHGTSPHADAMDYASMASDVLHFCRTHSLTNISLLGHSMGGKVAMALALSPDLPSELLSHLIIADITPSKGALSSEFRNYTDAMQKVEQSQVTTRKEANDIIQEVEPDTSIRAFLLTNLTSAHGGAPLKFRVPVNTIKSSLGDIGGFPYHPKEREWRGSTLLIKGERSKYVNKYNIPLAKQFFPNLRLEVLDSNHWVHAEKPREFVDLVVDFVKDT